MSVQAIPTIYRGIEFRSRLEADWAATLDSLGMTWIYEPEGYRLQGGSGYSPDFWLPDVRVWIEVKGSHNLRIELASQFDDALWADSPCTNRAQPDAPIVLIGREPRSNPITGDHDQINVQGAKYSAWFVRCEACSGVTVFVPGATTCRLCRAQGSVHHDLTEMLFAKFVRLPRPAGRR